MAVSKQLSQVETNTINSVRQHGWSIENYLKFLALCILARLHFISRLGADVKQTATQMLAVIFAMSGELSIIRAFIMQLNRGIDIGEHFVLEDATGRSFPIPLKTIISWEAFDVILADRFKRKKGERRIRRKLYSLHESTSHLEIDRSVAFGDAFVPNQKVDMSLICKAPDTLTGDDGDTGLSSCPWCRATSPGRLGARVKCVNCKRDFVRMVIEAEDVIDPPPVPSASWSQELQVEQGHSVTAKTLALQEETEGGATKRVETPQDKGKGSQQPDTESESDEENLSGLAHVTLQTRRIRRLPRGSLGPTPGFTPHPSGAAHRPTSKYFVDDSSDTASSVPTSETEEETTDQSADEEETVDFQPSKIVTFKLKKIYARRAKELMSLPRGRLPR